MPKPSRSLLAVLGLALFGCAVGAPKTASYRILVQAETDQNKPLEAVEILKDGTRIGVSGPDGRIALTMTGSEGEMVGLEVRCPALHTAKDARMTVLLRRVVDPTRTPTYRAECRPETRTVVVAVRAANGPDLPVIYLGKQVARTDASGVAHVKLDLPPAERFELALDTSGKAAEKLFPRSPSAVFVVHDRDELVFFNQRFERKKARASSGGPHLPKPI